MKSIVLTIMFALAALLAVSAPASAAIVDIKQHVSLGQLQGACASVGGQFDNYGSAGYACTNNNCDGKGGKCSVGCNTSGECTGTTPGRLAETMTAIRVLTNHYVGLLDDPDSSTPSHPDTLAAKPIDNGLPPIL